MAVSETNMIEEEPSSWYWLFYFAEQCTHCRVYPCI